MLPSAALEGLQRLRVHMHATDIARELLVTDRTVRRWLNKGVAPIPSIRRAIAQLVAREDAAQTTSAPSAPTSPTAFRRQAAV